MMKNTMGNQQSNTDTPQEVESFREADTVFLDNHILVTIARVLPDGYEITLPTGDQNTVVGTRLSYIAKAQQPAEIFSPRPREPEEDDEDDEPFEEPYVEAEQEHHPCGLCSTEWQCTCDTKDVDVNENYEDEIAQAMRESALEQAELEAALKASSE